MKSFLEWIKCIWTAWFGSSASNLCARPACSNLAHPGSRYCANSSKCASDTKNEIRFYDKDEQYYEFTNFSNHPITYEGKEYPTSEHLFQSLKFEDPADADCVRTSTSARDALTIARALRTRVRKDWVSKGRNIAEMEKALLLKFTQHEKLKQLLLGTGDATLIEDSPIDSFWGVGSDGLGRNQLGRSLMKVRDLLRNFQA